MQRKWGEECSTCKRTYGVVLVESDRCGCCLTGLSIDGRPVHPVESKPGTWVSPITGAETVQLSDGTWTFLWDEVTCASLGMTQAQSIEMAEQDRAKGVW